MAATIKDIARVTGVSIATVSRVINNLGGYNEETEKKVLAVAKALEYRKNENARSLVQKSTKTIGVIMPEVTTAFYGDIIKGIEDVSYEHGYSVILTHAGMSGARIHESMNLMGERRVDGLIIVSVELHEAEIESLSSLGIPFILLSTKTDREDTPYIKVDDFSAAYTAVNYLIENNHRIIAMAGANPDDPIAGSPRINGYIQALQDHGIKVDLNLIKAGDFSFESGKKAMQEYIENHVDITAVFCASDEAALGIISTCFENDLEVPKDISVVGYDNSKVSHMSIPPLTTVAQPLYEIGREGCLKLIASIQNKIKIESKVIPHELVVRKSVKKLS
ncbi:substrate-binding domain-containing protein [Paenibacillus sp. N3/727]|uniref:LacI family DNA-binding transcriptional regulator n=1 Tax=Paenibacillus sp. N3/727 TaxID=2925845 RepID=UPI001F539536|nr:substrate-binding domain-containing protein [Paenibacillus sp. N3/727]UNK18414.1 substrate-binding domain-containing protein [Paenibacillus sp. N3/727]